MVPRNAIWEQHGMATEPTVRLVDDMLMGEQNATVGYQSTHWPADLDAVTGHTRYAAELFQDALAMFTSVFAKAFKQIPHWSFLRRFVALAQWNPVAMKLMFFYPFTQLFGVRSSPGNFARYPACCCYAIAVLALIPAAHCVDDMLVVERASTIATAWVFWRTFADCCGWRVPDAKSPLPSQVHVALGALWDLAGFPLRDMVIRVASRRIEVLLMSIFAIINSAKLTSGQSGQLYGRLSYATTQMYGNSGGRCCAPSRRGRGKRGRT